MSFTERYVTNSGAGSADGSSLANAWSWATMLTTAAAGDRCNVQGAITRTTANDAFTNAGTTANPIVIQGINATVGDLEANGRTRGGSLVTTNFPVITYTTGGFTPPNFCGMQYLSFVSAKTNGVITPASIAQLWMRRSSIQSTHATASGAYCIDASGPYVLVTDCDLSQSSNNSGAVGIFLNHGTVNLSLITAPNGATAVSFIGTQGSADACMIRDAGVGVSGNSTGLNYVTRCSFRNISGNYLSNTGSLLVVQNCIAWGSGGSSKWYNSAASVRNHFQLNNAVGNMGAADTNLGNWPVIGQINLTADPYTSSTDLTLNSTAGGGAACKAAGVFQYLDLGGWQSQGSGAGPAIGSGIVRRV